MKNIEYNFYDCQERMQFLLMRAFCAACHIGRITNANIIVYCQMVIDNSRYWERRFVQLSDTGTAIFEEHEGEVFCVSWK